MGGAEMMTRDGSDETIVLDALRRFMINSDLSDQRISRLMGVEIETLRNWMAGTANPQKQSLNKISSFLKWHGRKYVITENGDEAKFLDIAGASQKSR
jgi:transcriptional regulator with XRE-family HTH domain